MKKAIYMLSILIYISLLLISCTKDDPSKTPTEPTSTPIEHFIFEEINDSITITKYTGSDNAVVLPASINNLPVTQIGANAFHMNRNILSVVLPDTITGIGISAFGNCEFLKTVVLPENLEEIGGCAFENCRKLTDITLPDGLKIIGGQAFLNCKGLKQVTISKECAVGIEAFRDSGLENVTFDTGVTHISDTCFAGTNIKTLILPETIQTIGWQAFANCQNLQKVSIAEGLVSIGDLAFYSTDVEEIIIPSTVTEVKETTFSNCLSLDKIKFKGNAPDNFLRMLQDQHLGAENVHFVICYHSDANGFSSPEWNGYPTEIW